MKRNLRTMAKALAVVAMLCIWSVPAADAQELKGQHAPHFELPVLDSEEMLSLEDLRGKLIVLHFGTGW